MSIYSRAASGTINIRLALYDASDGTFVGATVEISVANADAWRTALADGVVNVYAAKSYYLCVEQSANHYISYNTHANHDAYKYETYGGTWPSPVTWTDNTTYANAAIYATYAPGGQIVYLAGTIAAAAALIAAPAVERKLGGAIAGAGGVSPASSVERKLTVILAALGGVAGVMKVDRKLIAILAASGGLDGTLSVTSGIALAGEIAAAGNAVGAMTVIRTMLGALAAQGSLAGSLRANWALASMIAAQGGVAGSLSGVKSPSLGIGKRGNYTCGRGISSNMRP